MTNPCKHFVLDTNVLLHSPAALESFKENHVVIPIDVIEELDRFKSRPGELGANARECIRRLDDLRTKGRLTEGVPLNDEGGSLRIDLKSMCLLEHGLSSDIPDHRIISVAYRLKREGHKVVFVSKDMNLRIKSDVLGIETEDFLRQKVSFDSLSRGWREVTLTDESIDRFYKEKEIVIDTQETELYPFEGILLRSQQSPKRTALGIHIDKHRIQLVERGNEPCFGITPRNLQQRLALELLLHPGVHLVALIGKAGTGKTLLAIVAGLQLLLHEERFETLLISRPIMPLGKDLGYLPGGVSEKLEPWMKPIFDNLQFILRSKGRNPVDAKKKVNELIQSGAIQMEALTYIRGRSIHHQYLIIDECQNLTPHEVKTIISRAGHGTKIVLTGDPYQIDNPYLDAESNGLSFVCERMKTLPLSGHVVLKKTERSRLASIAADYL
jgi:PhoH-like ATPase